MLRFLLAVLFGGFQVVESSHANGVIAEFTQLNAAYVKKHGFPFIIAVRDFSKAEILSAFQTRLAHDSADEFETACRQVERIAELRLQQLLP